MHSKYVMKNDSNLLEKSSSDSQLVGLSWLTTVSLPAYVFGFLVVTLVIILWGTMAYLTEAIPQKVVPWDALSLLDAGWRVLHGQFIILISILTVELSTPL